MRLIWKYLCLLKIWNQLDIKHRTKLSISGTFKVGKCYDTLLLCIIGSYFIIYITGRVYQLVECTVNYLLRQLRGVSKSIPMLRALFIKSIWSGMYWVYKSQLHSTLAFVLVYFLCLATLATLKSLLSHILVMIIATFAARWCVHFFPRHPSPKWNEKCTKNINEATAWEQQQQK